MLLHTQGVEPNPGPRTKINLGIQTFNYNGLGNRNKLRRLLTKCRGEVSKGSIILLQETHLKDDSGENSMLTTLVTKISF